MMDELLSPAGSSSDDRDDRQMRGVAMGVVTDNQDPDNLGRVRVRLAFHDSDQHTFWARVAAPMATGSKGTYFLPEVDDEVLVAFECGDLSHPVVLGSLWSGQRPPPETNEGGRNDVRVIRSRADSELRFVDSDPASVEVKLADGKHLLMDDQGIVVEDGTNKIEINSQSGAMTISCSGALSLEGNTVSVQAKSNLELKASGTLSIQGSLVKIN